MYRLFGYDAETFTRKIDANFYLEHYTEETRIDALKKKESLLKSDVTEYSWIFEIVANDGQHKKLETHSKIIRDENNKPVKYLGSTRDVTQLKNYERNLEKTINELNRSNKELEEFAYVASHDLQEPLRKLSTFTERLTTRYSDKLDDDGKMYAERIMAATNNMRSLIENLLEFSRVAKSSAAFEQVELNDILNQSLQDNELSLEETGTKIVYDKLPTINAIRTQMLQLFNNLISNAIKFRKKDAEQVIKISCNETPFNIKNKHVLSIDKTYYTIQVKDKGIGFEQEYAERIFQIFQRLHGKVEYPGTGVGLAIVKKIIDNHKGVIYAEGTPGEGSIFTIIVPE
jgi:PAS domain S-box-containing protein